MGKTTIDFHDIVNQHGRIGAILILLVNSLPARLS